MKYLLQVYLNGAQQKLAHLPEAQRAAVVQDYVAFLRRPEVHDGNQLQPPATATTIHIVNGDLTATTGPYTAAGEPLGGYYLIEANDIATAVAIAAHNPAIHMGAAIEIRPVVER